MQPMQQHNPSRRETIPGAVETAHTDTPEQASRFTRSRRRRVLLMVLACIAYIIGFVVIENHYGKGGPTAAVLVVVAAGWLYGFFPGIAAALISFLCNWLLYASFGMDWKSILLGGGGIAGMLSLMLIGGILGRMRDLSRLLSFELGQRRRTEKELRASNRKLENLIDTSLDPIVITDADAAVVKPNKAFLDMIGSEEADVRGKPLYSFSVSEEGTYESTAGEKIHIGPDFLEHEIPDIMGRLNKKGKISNWETYYVNRDGKAVPVTQNIVWLYNDVGEKSGAFAIIRNITEQRKAERELLASREEAVEANRYRNRFFTNITHEFRTPLTLIIGPVEGILRGEFGTITESLHEQLSVALRNSRRLLKLVNQLLDFSMLDAGGSDLYLETRDPVQLASSVLESFSVIARQKNVQLSLEHDGSVPAVPLDAAKIEKIFFNLIGNAFKYTPPGGNVTVSVAKARAGNIPCGETVVTRSGDVGVPLSLSGNHILFTVADSGIGIKKEFHKTIFERFKQAGDGFEQGGGSGLGLAYTRELVERMGGQVTLTSKPGKGARFNVYLPVSEQYDGVTENARDVESVSIVRPDPEVELSDALPGETVAQEQLTGTKPLILIVDDNTDVRRFVAGIVKNGYDYLSACSGSEALHMMQTHTPDLIICDIMMPEMDGYAVLKQIKSRDAWKSIPFVFLTAKADPEMKIEGLEEGADDYIVKPFNSLELLARIRSLLRLRTLLLETTEQKREIVTLHRKLEDRYSYGNIVGNSPAMRKIYQILESVKDSDANVLISGETGTGKELIAHAIHYSGSRKEKPFISVNCGAIPKELMEREFFGHVKGAYTGAIKDAKGFFQAAHGGTLFLDEIGEMDKNLQVKLLRVLERGEFSPVGSSSDVKVDVRIIVATNKTLSDEVLSGNFREDLYFRVNVIPIHLPPLRQRREDIPLLIEHFLELYTQKHKKSPPNITKKDMDFFMNYSYPGNVRELQHMLERYCLMGASAESVMEYGKQESVEIERDNTGKHPTSSDQETLKEARHRIEKELIISALEKYKGNHSLAAKRLDISRAALYKKINQYDIR